MTLRILATPAHYQFDPALGSEYQWAYEILNGVASLGHDVTAVTGTSAQRYPAEKSSSLDVHHVWSSGTELDHRRRLAFVAKTWRTSARLLKGSSFDLVHHVLPFAFNRTFNPLALIEAKGLPFVLGPVQPPLKVDTSDETGVASRQFGSVKRAARLDGVLERAAAVPASLSRRTVRRADMVVAVSDEARDMCLDIDPTANVVVLPPGVDTRMFIPPEGVTERNDILVSGFLTKRKQVDRVVRALALVDEQNFSARLRIVGDGPERSALEALSQQLGISHRVIFEGAVSSSQMPRFYQAAAVVCFVSKDETVGMAAMEAMACGAPLVATATGIVPQLLTGNRSQNIVSAAPEAIAAALKRLLGDDALRTEQSRSGRALIEADYDWKQIANTYASIYEEAVSRRGAAVRNNS